jgi:hypothetical protein
MYEKPRSRGRPSARERLVPLRDQATAVASGIRHKDGVAVACDIVENAFESRQRS